MRQPNIIIVLSFISAFAFAAPQQQQQQRQRQQLATTVTTLTTTNVVEPRLLNNNNKKKTATTIAANGMLKRTTSADDSSELRETTLSINSRNGDTILFAVDTSTSSSDVTTTTEDEFVGVGIEGKSISSSAEDNNNSLQDERNLKTNDKLSIVTDQSESNIQGDDSAPNNGAGSDEIPLVVGQKAPPGGGRGGGGGANSVNMSQIDQIYTHGRRDAEQVAKFWHDLSIKLKKGIGQVIGSLVPKALNMTQEAKLAGNCSGALLKWILSMNHLKAWALKMLDASGKPIAGLLEGSLTMFGNYRQCLKVRAPDDDEVEFAGGEFREYFRGKYCIIQAKPWLPEKDRFYNLNTKLEALMTNKNSNEEEEEEENPWWDRTIFEELSEWMLAFNFVDIRMDLCLPSVCRREDIQSIIQYLLQDLDLKARVLRCESESRDGSGFNGIAVESSDSELFPQTTTTTTTTTDAYVLGSSGNSSPIIIAGAFVKRIGWALIPVTVILIVLIATTFSFLMQTTTTTTSSSSNHSNHQEQHKRSGKFSHTVKSLSLKRSIDSHLNVDYDQLADEKPLALYGIRFILVLWVIFVESAINLKFEYLRELMTLKDLIFWWPLQFIINSTLQFDSLILLTAFTMGYKICLNDGIGNTKKALRKFIIDKFIRLMPSIMFMVVLVILLPMAYRGPVWNDYVVKQSAICRSNGWINFFFLQNYLSYKEICLPNTWLISVEFQLILILAPVVYYLNKSYLDNLDKRSAKSKADCTSVYANDGKYKLSIDTVRLSASNNLAAAATAKEAAHLKRTSSSRMCAASRPIYWLRTLPGAFLMGCIAIGFGSSFYNVYSNNLPPSWFYTMADPDSKAIYFNEHLMRILTHLAVFSMGLLAGLECRRSSRNTFCGYKGQNLGGYMMSYTSPGLTKQDKSHSSSVSSSSLPGVSLSLSSPPGEKMDPPATIGSNNNNSGSNSTSSSSNTSINIQTASSNSEINYCGASTAGQNGGVGGKSLKTLIVDIIGCLVVITTMSAVIFSTHDWSLNDLPAPPIAGLYDVGSRFLWSMALIWILYMVSVPNVRDRQFSPISRLLGHPFMVFLGKLSFLVYIIHPFVHLTVLAIQEQPIYSSWLMLIHVLIGNITITVILASLVSLFVEMPCRNLFRRCGSSLFLTHTIGSTTTTTNTETINGESVATTTTTTNNAAAATSTASAAATTTNR